MPTINGRSYSRSSGFSTKVGNGVYRFEIPNKAPSITSGELLLYSNSSSQLVYNDGSTETIIGAGGSLITHTLNDAYDDGSNITVDAGAVIMAGANEDTAVLNITLDGPSAGAGILFANSGTGNDITGSAGWSVTKAGLATFATNSVVSGVLQLGTGAATGTLQSNGNFNLILQTGNSTTSTIEIVNGANGDVDVTLDGTGAVNINGTTTHNDALVVAAGDFAVTLGHMTLTDDQNANSMTVTNNTHTTDSATTGGVVEFRSTSLTTGTLLNLELTEGTLNGGEYLRCYDVTAGGDVFKIGEDGAVVITGAASNDMFTITNGDAVMADGSLTITDADNAASLVVTNNSAAANDMVTFISSGTTTGSLLRLTSTGTILTTGSVLEIVADTATTSGAGGAGRGVSTISADALTTGIAFNVSSLSNEAMTSGGLAKFEHSASGTTVAAITGALVDIQSSVTESGTSTQDYDLTSIKRTSIHNTAGTLTAQGSVLKIENVATETNATLTDTVVGLEVVMDVDGDGAGISVTTNQATTGVSIDVISSGATSTGSITVTNNALTTGTAMLLTSSGTIATTGDLLTLVANSATTSTGLLRISGTALTNGSAIEITGGGSNYLTAGNLVDIGMGAATVGSGLVVTTTGIYADAGVGVVNFVANSATTGDLVVLSATSQTTGNLILATGGGAALLSGGSIARFNMGAAIAGSGLEIVTTGVYVDATDGLLNITANSATSGNIAIVNATAVTTGTLLELNGTGGTMTTGNYLVCNDASLDVFAVKRNGHLATRQTTKPTVAVGTQNGVTNAAISNGSTDTAGTITTTGTSAAGDTIFTVTFEEAYAVAPVVFIQPANEAAAQNADDATSGAYVSSTTTGTFVVTIPGASGATPSFDYFVFEIGS